MIAKASNWQLQSVDKEPTALGDCQFLAYSIIRKAFLR